MKPDWDKLMEKMNGDEKFSSGAVIADVDCTVEQGLCSKFGVMGYPTIKYGDPNDMQAYNGGRDYAALEKHAKENLGPSCGPDTLDLCDEDQKNEIQEVQKMSDEDIAAKVESEEKKLADAESNFKEEVQKLQKKYEELTKEKEATTEEVRGGKLGVLKKVLASRTKAGKPGTSDEEL
eukprot:538566_1